jgi:hypothetical protein
LRAWARANNNEKKTPQRDTKKTLQYNTPRNATPRHATPRHATKERRDTPVHCDVPQLLFVLLHDFIHCFLRLGCIPERIVHRTGRRTCKCEFHYQSKAYLAKPIYDVGATGDIRHGVGCLAHSSDKRENRVLMRATSPSQNNNLSTTDEPTHYPPLVTTSNVRTAVTSTARTD